MLKESAIYTDLLRLANFESIVEARDRTQRAHRIAIASGKFDEATLAEWAGCRIGALCSLMCCELTMRHRRRRLVPKVVSAFAEAYASSPGRRRYMALSVVPPTWLYSPGTLATCSLKRLRREFGKVLVRAGLSEIRVFGGFDFSYDEFSSQPIDPFWSVHLYLIIEAPKSLTKTEIAEKLRDQLPASSGVPCPVRPRVISDPIAPITYTIKSRFFRRVGYRGRDGRMTTIHRGLKRPQELELMAFLAQLRFKDRFVLQGFRWKGRALVLAR